MRVRNVVATLTICCTYMLLSNEASAQDKQLAREVDKINFSVLYPPRTGYAPGQIFRYMTDTQGRRQTEVLCANLFASTPNAVVTNDWILSKRTYKTGASFSAAVSWLKGALSFASTASGSLAANVDSDKVVTISFGDVKHNSVPVEERFQETSPVVLSNACQNALDSHKESDPKLKNLYVVAETLTSSSLRVELNRKVAAKIGLDVGLNDVVTVAPNVGFTYDNEGVLAGSTGSPITFAYYAVRVSNYVLPSGAVADGTRLLGVALDEEAEEE